MRVVDEGPRAWLLFEREDGLFLDVNCSHSAAGYVVLIHLKPEEEAQYAREGRAFLDRFAQEVQDRGPFSILQNRNLYTLSYETKKAFEEWRRQAPEQ
ncbi:MAG: hypothetical protein M3R13_07445 [Armatimonadota bacterium]|nr:hypothetical protein [Armatimonadota bacterium]